MGDEERLRRIDENLELSKDYMREGHELMARIDATMERNTEAFERNTEALGRNTEAFLGLRAYLDGATRMLAKMAAEIGADRDESRAYRESVSAKLDRLLHEPPPAAA